MVTAYLVTLPRNTVPSEAVFLDCERAVSYAAQHHGSVAPLVLASALDRLKVELEELRKMLESLQ